MDTLLIFFLNRSFFDIAEKNQNRFLKLESFSHKSKMVRKISSLSTSYTRLVEFDTLLGYKHKIRLVSIFRKREDH